MMLPSMLPNRGLSTWRPSAVGGGVCGPDPSRLLSEAPWLLTMSASSNAMRLTGLNVVAVGLPMVMLMLPRLLALRPLVTETMKPWLIRSVKGPPLRLFGPMMMSCWSAEVPLIVVLTAGDHRKMLNWLMSMVNAQAALGCTTSISAKLSQPRRAAPKPIRDEKIRRNIWLPSYESELVASGGEKWQLLCLSRKYGKNAVFFEGPMLVVTGGDSDDFSCNPIRVARGRRARVCRRI